MFATLTLTDMTGDISLTPEESGLLAVPQAGEGQQHLRFGDLQKRRQHRPPTDKVVSCRSVDRYNPEGGIALAPRLDLVSESLGASPSAECGMVRPARLLNRRRKLLRAGACAAGGLAKGNEAP